MSPDPDRAAQRLSRLAPGSRSALEALAQSGVLARASVEDGRSVAASLLAVLEEPRHRDLDRAEILDGLLERLLDPLTNTQVIAVPFATGENAASTCVAAARVGVLLERHPAEYARAIAGLTSPALAFTITRTYLDPGLLEQKRRWLDDAFAYGVVDPATLRIEVRPDPSCVSRALQEHLVRRPHDGGGPARPGRRGTRRIVDVLMQSALMNYALRGQYDSSSDTSRATGLAGVPFEDEAGRLDFGYQSLQHDLLAWGRVVSVELRRVTPAPGALDTPSPVGSAAAAPDVAGQMQGRVQQLVIARVDGILMAALDQRITQLVDEALTRHVARLMGLSEASAASPTSPAERVARAQQLMAGAVGSSEVEAAIEALVERRVADLLGVAGLATEPARPRLDLTGVPVMTEEEAVREAMRRMRERS